MAANPSIQLGTDGNWAIKEDNLLAYKKDGDRFFNKEFDFTRGSLATFVDKDGLIKYSGVTDTELVTNGNFDTDSDWTLGAGWSISDGKVIRTAQSGSTSAYQNVSFSGGKIYKIQYDLDISDGSFKIRISGGALVDTPVRSTSGTYTEYIVANSGNNILNLRANDGAFVGSIDNVSVVEIQTDVPRIDFTDDATGHLLLEPQRTNIIAFSEGMFDSSHFNKILGVIAEGQQTDLNGTNTAVKLSNFVQSSARLDYNSTVAAVDGKTYTYSAYYKGSGDIRINVSTSTGIGGFGEKTINLTDEWVRHSITATFSNPTGNVKSHLAITRTPNNDAEVYLCFAQIEEGSYATSYIPTYGTSRTRNRDLFGQIDFVNEIKNATNFSFFYETSIIEQPANDNDSFRVYGDLGSQTMGEYQQTNNRVYYADSENNTRIISVAVPYTPNVPHKVAWQVNNSDLTIKLFVNGVLIRTATLLEAFVLDYYRLGSTETTLKYNSLAMFPTVLTDGEAYLLTVTQYQSYQEMATALNYTL